MVYIKYKTSPAKISEIKDFYQASLITDPKRKYDYFQVQTEDGIQVFAYKTSSPDLFTVVFSGPEEKAVSEARIFFKEEPHIERTVKDWLDTSEQIGSDEVGVGDYFLGFYVCAVYLDKKDVEFIDSLGVKDSKQLSDSQIESIAPQLLKRIKKEIVRLSPDKLMQLKEKKWSTHVMLANAHNFAHAQLMKKYSLSSSLPVYIDQFEKEEIYRHYVGNKIVPNPLIFRTKGETYYPSVATASVLARYAFLLDWADMEAHFGLKIPKGAPKEADKTYIQLVKKFGREEVDPYVKRFFSNYQNDNKD